MAPPKKNTGKAPSVQFYWADFIADMQGHPTVIVGAWFLVLCQIWNERKRGSITRTIEQFALIMHTDVTEAQEFVDYLRDSKIANAALRNGKITLTNRRTKRDTKLLDDNRLRQQRFREKHGSNGDVAPQKGNPSSSTPTPTPISTPTPTPLIGIGIEESSPKSGGLGLKKEIGLKVLKFTDGLTEIFHSISRDEATTFARIAQFLVDQILAGQLGLEIFDEALRWAEDSITVGAKSPKAFFVAKVKQETGFTGRGKLLNDRRKE